MRINQPLFNQEGQGGGGGGGEQTNAQALYSGNIGQLEHASNADPGDEGQQGGQGQQGQGQQQQSQGGQGGQGQGQGSQGQGQQRQQGGQQSGQQQGHGQQGQGQGGQGGQQSNVSPTDMATIMADALKKAGVGAGQQQQQQSQQRQITDEEFRTATQYFSVKPEHIQMFFGKPPVIEGATAEQQTAADTQWIKDRVTLMQGMLDGAARHAVMLAGMQTQHLTGQLRDGLSPLIQERQQQQEDANIQRLIDGKVALKGMPNGSGKQVILTAIQALRQSGYKPVGNTPEEMDNHATKAVYDKVSELAKLYNPNFNLDQPLAGSGQQQKGGGRAAGMAGSVNGAGGSGAHDGSGGGSGEAKTGFRSLYETVSK